MDLQKIPPHDEEAEQAVIGSMLTDQEAVVSAIESLKSEDFYRSDNATIYEAIMSVYAKGEPIDIITVKEELVSMGKLDSVGGLEYLASLPEKVPTTANVEKYVNIVEEKSILRSLIKTANELISLGYSQQEDVTNIMDDAEKKIFNIMQKKTQNGYDSIKNILVESFENLQELYKNKKHITGVASGFIDLDNRTSGFHKDELILIAARPSMGKTAFALNIATNAAVNSGTPVVVFSLEMSKEQCANRILCSQAMVDSSRVGKGEIDDEEWAKLATAAGELSDSSGIIIDDTPGITVAEIRAKCRKLKIEKDIGLVVIDYLQLITGSGKTNSREQEIAEISRSLKILAKELAIPVIALSQLSRAPEARPDHRPMLQDLRESGSIEQDADVVMFIYRDDYYNQESEKPNIAEIIISKNRSGPLGITELLWMPQFTKFANKYNGD